MKINAKFDSGAIIVNEIVENADKQLAKLNIAYDTIRASHIYNGFIFVHMNWIRQRIAHFILKMLVLLRIQKVGLITMYVQAMTEKLVSHQIHL